MVRMYLPEEIIVKREELVYRVSSIDIVSNWKPQHLVNLELVCGWDYLDEECEELGWKDAKYFSEAVQCELVPHYFVDDSMLDALAERGFEVVGDTLEFREFL